MFLAIAVDNLADAESLTTIEKDEEKDAQGNEKETEEIDEIIERKKSLGSKGSRRSMKSLKKRRNTQLHLDIEAAASENLMQRYLK